jgi:hypothetical protein
MHSVLAQQRRIKWVVAVRSHHVKKPTRSPRTALSVSGARPFASRYPR